MLSSQVKFSADRQTDRRTPVTQYAPDLSMQGYKNEFLKKGISCFLWI